MRHLIPLLLLLATTLHAEGLLGHDWHYRHGDDPTWLAPETAAADWPSLNLGISWEQQGVNNGNAVLLQRVSIPATLRPAGLVLRLRLGADATDLFLNGHQLLAAAPADRISEVAVPSELVCWGSDNLLALRVRNHQWTGGACTDFAELRAAGPAAAAPSIAALYPAADHVFSGEGEPVVPIRLGFPSGSPVAGELSVSIVSDLHEPIFRWDTPVTPATAGLLHELCPGPLAPGFYQVVARFTSAAAEEHVQHVSWFAVEPERIVGTFVPPADVAGYWARAKRDLAAVPPAFRLVEEPALSTPLQRVHTAEMRSLDGVTLRAWYVVPTSPGPHPVTVHVPGYSAAMRPEWFLGDSDMIHLGLDIRGHGRSADVFNPGFGTPGLVGHHLLDPESYVYRQAFMDCGRALEFLATRPEVDQARIAVEGGSQGGGLAVATAALYPDRIALCAVGVPFLGGFEDHIRVRTVYREELATYLKLAGHSDWSEVERTMRLIDTQNLAPLIRCPVMMTVGLFDDDCPPRIGFAVFNRLTCPRTFTIRPDSAHLLEGQWGKISRTWIRRQFGLKPESTE